MYCIVKVVYLYCESESGKVIIRLKNKVSGAKIDNYLGIMVIAIKIILLLAMFLFLYFFFLVIFFFF